MDTAPQHDAHARTSVCFVTLGCAKNEVDSADMAQKIARAGMLVVDDPSAADCIVVNTCSFIQAATEESLQAIFELSGLENVELGKTKIVVAGCMPARYGADLEAELHEAAAFVPCSKEDDIASVVAALFDDACEPSAADVGLAHGPSAYVKISDGCNRFCSFCTIPFIRGRYHSFTYEQIAADVQAAVDDGAREIVLIAQDTGRWGDDFEEPSTLAHLVSKLADAHASTWFRIMYIQPEGITDELVEAVAAHDNICNYFDIPFQHCSPEILSAMNRRGSAGEYLDLVARIRDRIPDVTLRTTLIAGFPGETDADFEALCDFVEQAQLDYVGVFPYSREDGTRAAAFDNQVDDDEILERAQGLRDVADSVSHAVVAARVGAVVPVVVLGYEEDGQLYGRAMCQAPEVDGVTYLDQGSSGDVCLAKITDTLLYEMEGTVVEHV